MAAKTYTLNQLYNPFGEAETRVCECCSPLSQWLCEAAERRIADEAILAAAQRLFTLSLHTNWADLMDAEEAAFLAAESAAARTKRLAEEADAERMRALTCESATMSSYADFQKSRNTVVIGKGRDRETHLRKVGGPCKWLYCNEKAPRSQWAKNAEGKWCAPVVKYLTGSECWAHEYTDPKRYAAALKGGKSEAEAKAFARCTPRTCAHIHPNEAGWLPQWNTDRTFRPDRVAEGLAALRGVPAPAIPTGRPPVAPARPQSRAEMAGGGDGWAEVKRKERSAW